MKNVLLFSTLLLFCCGKGIQADDNGGILQLDSFNFNKTVNAFKFTFVKFDSSSSVGPKHESFALLAQEIAQEPDILMAQVLLLNNKELATRFKLEQHMLPEIVLFKTTKKPGQPITQKETRYGDEVSLDHMRRFLQGQTGIRLGLPGCVKEMDELAHVFARNSGKDQMKVLRQAEEALDKMGQKGEGAEKARRYVKFMKVSLGNPEFVPQETKRIEKLLENQMSQNNREEMQKTLNVLKSFHIQETNNHPKDEF